MRLVHFSQVERLTDPVLAAHQQRFLVADVCGNTCILQEGSQELGPFNAAMGVPSVAMGATMSGGSGSSMGATMERSKFNFVMPTPVVKGPKLDDGGSGGDIGKINRNGAHRLG